jgi:hypothetical protein
MRMSIDRWRTLALCMGSVISLAHASPRQDFALPDHGALHLMVPEAWNAELRQPPDRLPPTIAIRPRRGASFEILITAAWTMRPETSLPDLPMLRAQVAAAARDAQSQSVEKSLLLRRLVGPAASGYYFTATDRAPKPGEYKYLTQGSVRTGAICLLFTVLTNDGQETIVSAALEMLRNAVHESSASAERSVEAHRLRHGESPMHSTADPRSGSGHA